CAISLSTVAKVPRAVGLKSTETVPSAVSIRRPHEQRRCGGDQRGGLLYRDVRGARVTVCCSTVLACPWWRWRSSSHCTHSSEWKSGHTAWGDCSARVGRQGSQIFCPEIRVDDHSVALVLWAGKGGR